MKRQNTRGPSPTPTAFSGISSYHSDSYRPIRDTNKPGGSSSSAAGNNNGGGGPAPAVPSLDARIVARTHFDELKRYLAVYLARAPANSRSTARQKLTRLTKQQFQELSTDVYDELVRRKKNSSENEVVPFLPLRDDFHPKRNQARQKLATLPATRFEDLSSDVYYELARRYPEFEEEEHPSSGSAYDDVPSPDFPSSTRSPPTTTTRTPPTNPPLPTAPSTSTSTPPTPATNLNARPSPGRRPSDDRERGMDSGYGSSSRGGGVPQGGARRRPSEDEYAPPPRRSEDVYNRHIGVGGRSSEDNNNNNINGSAGYPPRRKPSQDTNALPPRRSEDRERGRPPTIMSQNSDSTNTAGGGGTSIVSSAGNATSATGGMIIPNKSTIAEEDIEVPYGVDRGGAAVGGADTDGVVDSGGSEYLKSPVVGLSGLSGLTARLRKVGTEEDEEDDDEVVVGVGERSGGEEYYDKMSLGRTSVASDRFGGASGGSGRGSVLGSVLNNNNNNNNTALSASAEDQERMRREYEYKIATMQNRIAGLERDLGGKGERERERERGERERVEREKMREREIREREGRLVEAEERVRVMEEELLGLRRRAEEQSTTMRALQKELDELRRDKARARENEDELEILRERCERLERERGQHGGGTDPDMLDQLRSDMEGLLTELSDLSKRNDELLTAKDADLVVIKELDGQLKEYKRKYEQAKTELRSVKATSQLFLQAPKLDDQLPVSPDGGLLDIHVTAFVSAIDGLLTAGRSNAPTRVLTPMKTVVNAVSAIIEDVRLFEQRRQHQVDMDALRSLRDRADATLSNLVTASKTHATSLGMSPVSLLDAAASHVSATVTEIGRTVCIRKASRAQEDIAGGSPVSSSIASMLATGGFSPSLRAVEIKPLQHQKKASSASSRRMDMYGSPSSRFADIRANAGGRPSGEDNVRRLASEPSSSDTNSPPPIFDHPPSRSAGGGLLSDDSANADGSEDAWAELKPYLEAQTESIVYAIQSVLSGVRAPTPSPTLNENITQIITIVSSIVAVCNDNLPPASAQQGNDILRELSEHANKLSEVQAMPEVTKESRQIMAKSSFAVANAMKGLMKL